MDAKLLDSVPESDEADCLQCGDPITLRLPLACKQKEMRREGGGEFSGFFGGIRDDGGTVLFINIAPRGLVRCYWPAEQAEGLMISRFVPAESEMPRQPK